MDYSLKTIYLYLLKYHWSATTTKRHLGIRSGLNRTFWLWEIELKAPNLAQGYEYKDWFNYGLLSFRLVQPKDSDLLQEPK